MTNKGGKMDIKVFFKTVLIALLMISVVAGVIVVGVLLATQFTDGNTGNNGTNINNNDDTDDDIDLIKPKRYFNFVVLGVDNETHYLTDVVIMCNYDKELKRVNLVNIPRDTYITGGENDQTSSGLRKNDFGLMKMNAAYGIGGIEQALTDIERITGFRFQKYVVVELDVLEDIMDIVGGVYYDVERDMNYEDPTQDLKIHLEKGYQFLNSDQIIQYIRYRGDNSDLMDIQRIQNQQNMLKAIGKSLIENGSVSKIISIANAIINNTKTNITYDEIEDFISVGSMEDLIDFEEIRPRTLKGDLSSDGRFYRIDQDYIENTMKMYLKTDD